jgi:hypothetical protein
MESLIQLGEIPFKYVRPPHVRAKVPQIPTLSTMTIFGLVFASYFLVMSGIIYDIIVEPPSIGSARDEVTGQIKPQAILKYRINGQFIIEGLSAGMMFSIGGGGIILVNQGSSKNITPQNRYILIVTGVLLTGIAYSMSIVFIRMKIPGYGLA